MPLQLEDRKPLVAAPVPRRSSLIVRHHFANTQPIPVILLLVIVLANFAALSLQQTGAENEQQQQQQTTTAIATTSAHTTAAHAFESSATTELVSTETLQQTVTGHQQQTENNNNTDNGHNPTSLEVLMSTAGEQKQQQQQVRQSQLEPETQGTNVSRSASSSVSAGNNNTTNITLTSEKGQQKQQQSAKKNLATTPTFALHRQVALGAGGAGREPSGPQLYAQNLYSSQAPKLAYHAHSPYFKQSTAGSSSIGSGSGSGSVQGPFSLSVSTLQAQIPSNAGQTVGTTSQQQQQEQTQPLEAPPGGGQLNPTTYSLHHMRNNNYLAGHHLRTHHALMSGVGVRQPHNPSLHNAPSISAQSSNSQLLDDDTIDGFLARQQKLQAHSGVVVNMTAKLILDHPNSTLSHQQQQQASNSQQQQPQPQHLDQDQLLVASGAAAGGGQVAIDWTNQTTLIKQIELMLDELDDLKATTTNESSSSSISLVLSQNELQFELWTELYALLAQSMRTQNLIHLDLSNNSLAKLGITFTGYIEHQLVAHNGWPQLSATGQLISSSVHNNSNHILSNEVSTNIYSNNNNNNNNNNINKKATSSSNRMMRHTLFLGGKLYTLIQKERALKQLLIRNSTTSSWAGTSEDTDSTSGNNSTISPPAINNSTLNTTTNHTATTFTALHLPIRLRSLDLSHNKIKWLIKDQFKALKRLQILRLESNKIRYIHQHAFIGLDSLKLLDLSSNQLQVIYIEQFQTNYNLQRLNLQDNNLAYIRGGTFASLPNLKHLDLSRNKITILSNNAFIGLESLETLNCSSNQFVHVPSASFHPMTNLRRLDMSSNLITQLAPGTFFHLSIEELTLSQNSQLVSIDRGAFWDLPHLRHINLNSCTMLMSIHSQAFVGTQNLELVNVEDCLSLDSSAKELFQNLTSTVSSNHRFQDKDHTKLQTPSLNIHKPHMNLTLNHELDKVEETSHIHNNVNYTSDERSTSKISNTTMRDQQVLSVAKDNIGIGQQRLSNIQPSLTTSKQHLTHKQSRFTHYIYYLGTVTLLVVILKLVFKFTSTNRYLLEARRRRRQIYEAHKHTDLCQPDASLSLSNFDCHSLSHLSGSMSDVPHIASLPDKLLMRSRARSLSIKHQEESNGLCSTSSNTSSEFHQEANPTTVQVENTSQSHVEEEAEESTSKDRDTVINEVLNLMPQHISGACYCDCSSAAGGNETLRVKSDHGSQEQLVDEQQNETNQLGQNGLAIGVNNSSFCADCLQSSNDVPDSDKDDDQCQVKPSETSATINLIHSQLVAAGFDYGHANCAHFYQSLGPALQLADMTASLVNSIEYY